MALTPADVSRIAHLARLELNADESAAMLAQLNGFFSIVEQMSAVDCGDGYFLLGDDSADSWDSRYEGPFERWRVRGRAWLIVGPSGRRGWVNP